MFGQDRQAKFVLQIEQQSIVAISQAHPSGERKFIHEVLCRIFTSATALCRTNRFVGRFVACDSPASERIDGTTSDDTRQKRQPTKRAPAPRDPLRHTVVLQRAQEPVYP